MALVPCRSEADAIALVAELRREPAVAAIEHMDRRCLDILHEDGADRRHDVRFPAGTALALLVQLELPPGTTEADAFNQIEASLTAGAADTALARVCRLLHAHGVFDDTEMALPGNARRAEQLIAVREAVPAGVNQRVGRAQHEIDPRIAKTAADMIVPFERFGEMMAIYREGYASRGLDFAVWGHISDGNVHPNVLPRRTPTSSAGKEAILYFGREVARLGGCPLAEHGVGRNPVKQALLRGLYGDAGIEEMRAVKRALDPEWKLAPGVIFPALSSASPSRRAFCVLRRSGASAACGGLAPSAGASGTSSGAFGFSFSISASSLSVMLRQVTDEQHQPPGVLVAVLAAGAAERGHAGEADAVLDDREQLAVGQRLRAARRAGPAVSDTGRGRSRCRRRRCWRDTSAQ